MELKNVTHTSRTSTYMTLNIMMIAVKCIFVKDHHHHHRRRSHTKKNKIIKIQNNINNKKTKTGLI